MNAAFLSSYAVLWLLVLVLSYQVLHLLRSRSGLLMPPTALAATDEGLAIGERFPQMEFRTADGSEVRLLSSQKHGTIVVFTAPGCPACMRLYPHLAAFTKTKPEFETVVLSFSLGKEHEPAINPQDFSFPWVPMPMAALPLFKTSGFPFAYLLSPEGKVVNKGVINREEHLGILVNSAQRRRAG